MGETHLADGLEMSGIKVAELSNTVLFYRPIGFVCRVTVTEEARKDLIDDNFVHLVAELISDVFIVETVLHRLLYIGCWKPSLVFMLE